MLKKTDKTKEKKECNWTMIMVWFIMFVIVAAVVCCIIGFFFHKFEYDNTNNIVITFLGALAAFVVISNYAQMVDIRNKTDERLDEMKDELEKKTEELSKKTDRIIQKIDAILSGELDIVAIKEKYKYEVKDITLIENAVYGRYYEVEFDDLPPVIAYVQGKKDDLKVEEVAYSDYMKRFPNKDDFDRMNSILGPLGIK